MVKITCTAFTLFPGTMCFLQKFFLIKKKHALKPVKTSQTSQSLVICPEEDIFTFQTPVEGKNTPKSMCLAVFGGLREECQHGSTQLQ